MDLQGRLTNPRESLTVAFSLLHSILARSETRRPGARHVQAQRRLNTAEIGALRDARHEGVTIDGLAGQFGIHRTTVLAHLRREGR